MKQRPTYGAMAAGLAALALAALTPQPAAAQAKADKLLTVVLGAEPPHLDGCHASSRYQGPIVRQNIVETLIEPNPADGSLMPRLATAWERVDPLTWRVKLRPGVTFHDGAPLNAASVKRSLDRTMSTTVYCSDKSRLGGDLKLEIAAIGEDTVEIKTSRPEPIMPVRLSRAPIVGPATPLDKQVLNPVGTGPYVFDEWQAGQQIVLKRNEKYWGTKPQAEGVRYIWRKESSVRAAMVEIGEADIAVKIAPQEATNPKTDFSYLNSETSMFRIDMSMPPLNDRRVRLAMHYALDLNSMPGGLMPKQVVRANQIVFPAVPGHNHEIDKRPYPYDPAKARQLLAEAKSAGVPVDTEITLISEPSLFANAGEVAEAVFTMFKAVGLNMKILAVEPGQWAKYLNKPFPEGRPPSLLQNSHDNNNGDPVFSVFARYGCEGGHSTMCDPDFDKAVVTASGLSGDERIKAWQEVFRSLHEDIAPYIMMFHMVDYIRISPRIAFVPDASTGNEMRIQEITFR